MPGPVFLEGKHVALRTVEESDLAYLQEQINNPRIWRTLGRQTPMNAEQEAEFFEDVVCEDEHVNLLIAEGETPVCSIGLHDVDSRSDTSEIGYWVDPEYHRMGYGSDAAARLVEYGFQQLGLHRIEARVFEFNDASQALLESVGFREEGVHRDAEFIDGEYQDVHWYGLLEGEWRDSH